MLGTAGRNSVGQLGVGGNADVHEPSTLQVQHKHEQCVCLAVAASNLINKFIPGPFTQQMLATYSDELRLYMVALSAWLC